MGEGVTSKLGTGALAAAGGAPRAAKGARATGPLEMIANGYGATTAMVSKAAGTLMNAEAQIAAKGTELATQAHAGVTRMTGDMVSGALAATGNPNAANAVKSATGQLSRSTLALGQTASKQLSTAGNVADAALTGAGQQVQQQGRQLGAAADQAVAQGVNTAVDLTSKGIDAAVDYASKEVTNALDATFGPQVYPGEVKGAIGAVTNRLDPGERVLLSGNIGITAPTGATVVAPNITGQGNSPRSSGAPKTARPSP